MPTNSVSSPLIWIGSGTPKLVTSKIPISTVTWSTFPLHMSSFNSFMPPRVSTVSLLLLTRPWSYTYFPTHRMALPHMIPSEPSALNIRICTSALSDGQMSTRPSDPMPKCLSLTVIAACSGLSTCSSKQLTYT